MSELGAAPEGVNGWLYERLVAAAQLGLHLEACQSLRQAPGRRITIIPSLVLQIGQHLYRGRAAIHRHRNGEIGQRIGEHSDQVGLKRRRDDLAVFQSGLVRSAPIEMHHDISNHRSLPLRIRTRPCAGADPGHHEPEAVPWP